MKTMNILTTATILSVTALMTGCLDLGVGVGVKADADGVDVDVAYHIRADGAVQETVTGFDTISAKTGGEALLSGDLEVEAVLTDLSADLPADADVVYVVDNTGSMTSAIEGVQEHLVEAMSAAPDRHYGLVVYRDLGDSFVAQTRAPLGPDTGAAIAAAGAMAADQGGDFPEHVAAGLDRALVDSAFRPGVEHHIVLVGDAPDHGHQDIPLDGVLDRAAEAGIRIHTVVIGCSDTCKDEIAAE